MTVRECRGIIVAGRTVRSRSRSGEKRPPRVSFARGSIGRQSDRLEEKKHMRNGYCKSGLVLAGTVAVATLAGAGLRGQGVAPQDAVPARDAVTYGRDVAPILE